MIHLSRITLLIIAVLIGVNCSAAEPTKPAAQKPDAFYLQLSDLLKDPQEEVAISGDPQVINDKALGAVVLFDGVDDAIFLDRTPLDGLTRFTVEVIFRQDAGGSQEPRFFHIGHAKGDRMLLET